MKGNNFNQDSDNKNSTNEEVFEKIEEYESVDNTNSGQDGTLRKEEITETNDTITDGEKNDISNQETFRAEEELVTTERAEGTYNMFANLCGNSQDKTLKEKGLAQNLSNYFKSKELKNILKTNGLDKSNRDKVTNKLKDYLKRYEGSTIDLTKLKTKFSNYFSEFKSCNKAKIEKNKAIGEKIDEIKEALLSYIQEEENRTLSAFDNQTFGGDFNSPRDKNNTTDKSFLDIPTLNISLINIEDNSNTTNQFYSQNTNEYIGNLLNSTNNERDNTQSWTIECNNSSKNSDKLPFQDQYQGLTPYEFHNISKEQLYSKYPALQPSQHKTYKQKIDPNTNKNSVKFTEKTYNIENDTDIYKIKVLIKIYESTFRHKISPATEKLIINLVLETEQYIEKVKQIVKDYKIKEFIKNKILKAIDESASKESVEGHLSKSSIGKKVLKIMQGQKQDEEVKDSYFTKLLNNANKIYEKAYNKYQGYNNSSKKVSIRK